MKLLPSLIFPVNPAPAPGHIWTPGAETFPQNTQTTRRDYYHIFSLSIFQCDFHEHLSLIFIFFFYVYVNLNY